MDHDANVVAIIISHKSALTSVSRRNNSFSNVLETTSPTQVNSANNMIVPVGFYTPRVISSSPSINSSPIPPTSSSTTTSLTNTMNYKRSPSMDLDQFRNEEQKEKKNKHLLLHQYQIVHASAFDQLEEKISYGYDVLFSLGGYEAYLKKLFPTLSSIETLLLDSTLNYEQLLLLEKIQTALEFTVRVV